MRRFSLCIDEEACWGCRTCEVACKQEKDTPAGVRLIAVTEEGPEWRGGKPHFIYRVRVCRQCEEPACMEACPAEAFSVLDTGIVTIDSELCTGCGACVEACPYGAVAVDADTGEVFKCDLCRERLEQGLLPACADNVCPAHCIHLDFTASE